MVNFQKLNFVKPMNYPTPYIICFQKKIKRRLKIDVFNLILIRKQIGYPLPKFSGFTGFTRHFYRFFTDFCAFLAKIRKITGHLIQLSLKNYEYCEYLCICSGSKGVFCLGLFSAVVNFGELMRNLKFTQARRGKRTQRSQRKYLKLGVLCMR